MTPLQPVVQTRHTACRGGIGNRRQDTNGVAAQEVVDGGGWVGTPPAGTNFQLISLAKKIFLVVLTKKSSTSWYVSQNFCVCLGTSGKNCLSQPKIQNLLEILNKMTKTRPFISSSARGAEIFSEYGFATSMSQYVSQTPSVWLGMSRKKKVNFSQCLMRLTK